MERVMGVQPLALFLKQLLAHYAFDTDYLPQAFLFSEREYATIMLLAHIHSNIYIYIYTGNRYRWADTAASSV